MLRTACYSWHVAHGGRMVDFAGWEMPVQYTSIIQEHQAVRQAAGLFDIAHMGRIKFTGPGRLPVCSTICSPTTSRSSKPGEIRYSLVTNESGGILDDVLVYRFESFYFLVVNASNRLKIVDWIAAHRAGFDVHRRRRDDADVHAGRAGPARSGSPAAARQRRYRPPGVLHGQRSRRLRPAGDRQPHRLHGRGRFRDRGRGVRRSRRVARA